MMNWIVKLVASKYTKSIVRHGMTVLAGWLLSLNVPASVVDSFVDSGTAVIIAAITFGIAQLLSFADKKKNQD